MSKRIVRKNFPLDDLKETYRLPHPIFVTQPSLPDLHLYVEKLKGIWDRKWLTNQGHLHIELEKRLAEFLGVEFLSLFCNGTIALMVALEALDIRNGEVITTPFTFPATVHALNWNRVQPVFCDIDRKRLTIDPEILENHINSDTKAILGVHVYGNPCDCKTIDTIVRRFNLPVIYDAAHAFAVKYDGQSILLQGDISMLSFHATKMFTTAEGGALVSKSESLKRKFDLLKNFGIAGEEEVLCPGINGKMNELQAALGLLHLDLMDEELKKRAVLAELYREKLGGIPGISYLKELPEVEYNHAYFPIFVSKEAYGLDRDSLHQILKQCNVNTRKYFYPLCSDLPSYQHLPSANPDNLPNAQRAAREVLCLPIYAGLEPAIIENICGLISEMHALSKSDNEHS